MHKQDLVINTQAGATMSSREIAELTGKRHTDVMRDIRNMLAQLEVGERRFASSYFSDQNKELPCFNLDRIHVECLLTGYSIPLRMKVLERLSALEQQNAGPAIPSSFADALRLAADQQEQIQQLQLTNQSSAKKIDVLEQLLAAGVSAPEFCRRLNGVNTQKINSFLLDAGWLFMAGGRVPRWRVASYARDKYMAEKAFEVSRSGADPFTVTNPVLLKAGAKRLVDLYMSSKLPMKVTWDGALKHDLAGVLGVVK